MFFPREMEDGPDAVFLFRLSCLHIMSHGRRRISNPEKRYQSSSDVVVSVQMLGCVIAYCMLHVTIMATSTNVSNNATFISNFFAFLSTVSNFLHRDRDFS
jgi:hypothetical protein